MRANRQSGTRLPGGKSRVIPSCLAAVVLLLAAGTLQPDRVGAGDEKGLDSRWQPKPTHVHQNPAMQFIRGTLESSGQGTWQIGRTPVIFNGESRLHRWDDPERNAAPSAGQTYILMGYRRGPYFVVWNGTMLDPMEAFAEPVLDPRLEWTEGEAPLGKGHLPE